MYMISLCLMLYILITYVATYTHTDCSNMHNYGCSILVACKLASSFGRCTQTCKSFIEVAQS